VKRDAILQSPVMELTGHTGEVFAARFDPSGQYIASGSMDRSIRQFPDYNLCDRSSDIR